MLTVVQDLLKYQRFQFPCLVLAKGNNIMQINPTNLLKNTLGTQLLAIPFLDHLISELSLRLDEHTKKAAPVQHLLPVQIHSSSSVQDIERAVAFYGDDLPNKSTVDEGYERWMAKWISIPSQERPQSLSDSLRLCCSTCLPNIFTLLKLFTTLPLSSCSCE